MSSTLDSVPKEKSATGDVGKLKVGKQEIDLPIVVGTEEELAVDISKLRSQTGFVTLDDGYANTGACTSAITYLDGEKGVFRYRGYPIEVLAERSDFRRSQLPVDLRRTAHRRRSWNRSATRCCATPCCTKTCGRSTTACRAMPIRWRRSARWSVRFRRSTRIRSIRTIPQQVEISVHRLDGQAAHHRGLQLQEIDRPAVHLSAQRPVVLRELPAHDVRGSVRAVSRRSGFRGRR